MEEAAEGLDALARIAFEDEEDEDRQKEQDEEPTDAGHGRSMPSGEYKRPNPASKLMLWHGAGGAVLDKAGATMAYAFGALVRTPEEQEKPFFIGLGDCVFARKRANSAAGSEKALFLGFIPRQKKGTKLLLAFSQSEAPVLLDPVCFEKLGPKDLGPDEVRARQMLEKWIERSQERSLAAEDFSDSHMEHATQEDRGSRSNSGLKRHNSRDLDGLHSGLDGRQWQEQSGQGRPSARVPGCTPTKSAKTRKTASKTSTRQKDTPTSGHALAPPDLAANSAVAAQPEQSKIGQLALATQMLPAIQNALAASNIHPAQIVINFNLGASSTSFSK